MIARGRGSYRSLHFVRRPWTLQSKRRGYMECRVQWKYVLKSGVFFFAKAETHLKSMTYPWPCACVFVLFRSFQILPKISLNLSKILPKSIQNQSKIEKIPPRGIQEIQKVPKTRPRAPGMRPKSAQERSRGALEGPKRRPRAPKTAQEPPKKLPIPPKWRQKAVPELVREGLGSKKCDPKRSRK